MSHTPDRHTLIWHGHSNFELHARSDEGVSVVFIDPFFEGNPSAGPSRVISRADLVLVTHDHHDHVGAAVGICVSTGAQLVAMVETAARLQEAGVPASQIANGHGINIGGSIDLAGLSVTMTQATHSSATGVAAGYILRLADGFTIYHAGDTGIFAGMELWGRLYDIDLALLPIGGRYTMDPPQAAEACRLLGCKAVTPMHWGTFPVLEQNTERFQAELTQRAPDCVLKVMEIGKEEEVGR